MLFPQGSPISGQAAIVDLISGRASDMIRRAPGRDGCTVSVRVPAGADARHGE